MERPGITERLLYELCDNDSKLLSSLHHGLYETPLNEIYPLINLDDLIVFSASSWNLRKKNLPEFSKFAENSSLYEIFSEAYTSNFNPQELKGFVWLYKNRDVSPGLQDDYSLLNPFKKKDLEQRLRNASQDSVNRLKKNLQQPINEYLFECDYFSRKQEHSGDNSRLIVMGFQPYLPKHGIVEKRYREQIASMLNGYPIECSFDYEPQMPLF